MNACFASRWSHRLLLPHLQLVAQALAPLCCGGYEYAWSSKIALHVTDLSSNLILFVVWVAVEHLKILMAQKPHHQGNASNHNLHAHSNHHRPAHSWAV